MPTHCPVEEESDEELLLIQPPLVVNGWALLRIDVDRRDETEGTEFLKSEVRSVDGPETIKLCERDGVGPGGWVWRSALAMSSYVTAQDRKEMWRGKKVLELGSGTGVVGLALAGAGASVCLTDQEDLVPLLQENIEKNALDSAHATSFDWEGDLPPQVLDKGPFDFVVGSDLFYHEKVVQPLVRVLDSVAGSDTQVWLVSETRTTRGVVAYREFVEIAKEKFVVEEEPIELMIEHEEDEGREGPRPRLTLSKLTKTA